ncbi:MAG: type III PLP-dependent enzyme [Dehalococcoidia bacterium]|nr:type III PLP-dependent enzyme [Dehalococcoidia bacterium]
MRRNREQQTILYRPAAREALQKNIADGGGPILFLDSEAIKRKSREFRHEFRGAKTYYALKANPHPRIVELLRENSCAFEISSQGELEFLLDLKVPPREIMVGNPLKDRSFIKLAHNSGIGVFAFDSLAEVDKLAQFAPGSKLCVRLSVSNEGSEWPLSKKFGVEREEAIKLLLYARERNLVPYGITFHVGSQCTNPATWVSAIEESKWVWDAAEEKGIKMRMLNIGGGFPVRYIKPVPSLAEISRVVMSSVERNFPEGVELAVTPGRALVGEAGILVARVIAMADRQGERWLYLNVGVFNGLFETVGGIKYPLVVTDPELNDRKNGDGTRKWTLAGPSCDSFDVIAREMELASVEVGDLVHVMSAGAYTTSYASQFDGFPIPRTHFTA